MPKSHKPIVRDYPNLLAQLPPNKPQAPAVRQRQNRPDGGLAKRAPGAPAALKRETLRR